MKLVYNSSHLQNSSACHISSQLMLHFPLPFLTKFFKRNGCSHCPYIFLLFSYEPLIQVHIPTTSYKCLLLMSPKTCLLQISFLTLLNLLIFGQLTTSSGFKRFSHFLQDTVLIFPLLPSPSPLHFASYSLTMKPSACPRNQFLNTTFL